MTTSKIYLGDIGTEIILDTGTDITTSSSQAITVRKPSGQVVEWDAIVKDTNSVSYTTVADDIDEVGNWRLQAKVTTPIWAGLGETFVLIVTKPFA